MLTLATALAWSGTAEASCTFDAASRTVTASGPEVLLRVAPLGGIEAAGTIGGVYRPCGASVRSADTIVVESDPDAFHAYVAVDESRGAFAPGATAEASGRSAIEIVLVNRNGAPFDVSVRATPGNDVIDVPASGAVDLDGDGDGDVPWQRRVTVDAGDGDDRVTVTSEDPSGFYGPRVSGGPGDDVIATATPQLATLAGGTGLDTIDLGAMGVGFELDLATGAGTLGPQGQSFGIADDFESAVGGRGDDHLIGTAGPNTLWGGAGNDVLEGLAGRDTLLDGRGADTSRGGDGADLLIGAAGRDHLLGEAGNDTIWAGEEPAEADVVDGGAGRGDRAIWDALDVLAGVELAA